MLQDVYDSHEVNLLPGSTFSLKTNAPWLRDYAFAQNHQDKSGTVKYDIQRPWKIFDSSRFDN